MCLPKHLNYALGSCKARRAQLHNSGYALYKIYVLLLVLLKIQNTWFQIKQWYAKDIETNIK